MKKIIFTKIDEDCWKLHVDYDDYSSAQAFGTLHDLINTVSDWYMTDKAHTEAEHLYEQRRENT